MSKAMVTVSYTGLAAILGCDGYEVRQGCTAEWPQEVAERALSLFRDGLAIVGDSTPAEAPKKAAAPDPDPEPKPEE